MTATTGYPSALWPEGKQLLLLRASMLEGEEARLAFHSWRETTDFDALDHASFRMLPLLRWNISRLEIKDPILTRLDSVSRFLRVETAMKRNALKSMAQSLRTSGIDTLLLKGSSIGEQYYPHPSLRPMADCDLLIPHEDRAKAMAVLAGAGWLNVSGKSDSHHHSCDFYRREFPTLHTELHWRSGTQAKLSEDRLAWAQSREIMFEGIPSRVFRPEIEIIHACRHGMNWNPLTVPMRWLVDCAMIVSRSKTPIDWDFLVEMARKWEESLTVRESLSWISREFHSLIPDNVIKRLDSNHVGLRERSIHHLKGLPRDRKNSVKLYKAYLERELPVWKWIFHPRRVLGYFAGQMMLPDHHDIVRFFLHHFWRESEASDRSWVRKSLYALMLLFSARKVSVTKVSDRLISSLDEPNGICWQKRRVEFRGFCFPLNDSSPGGMRIRKVDDQILSDLPALIDQHPRIDLPTAFPDHPHAMQSGFSIIANIPKNQCRIQLEAESNNGWEVVYLIEIG